MATDAISKGWARRMMAMVGSILKTTCGAGSTHQCRTAFIPPSCTISVQLLHGYGTKSVTKVKTTRGVAKWTNGIRSTGKFTSTTSATLWHNRYGRMHHHMRRSPALNKANPTSPSLRYTNACLRKATFNSHVSSKLWSSTTYGTALEPPT